MTQVGTFIPYASFLSVFDLSRRFCSLSWINSFYGDAEDVREDMMMTFFTFFQFDETFVYIMEWGPRIQYLFEK